MPLSRSANLDSSEAEVKRLEQGAPAAEVAEPIRLIPNCCTVVGGSCAKVAAKSFPAKENGAGKERRWPTHPHGAAPPRILPLPEVRLLHSLRVLAYSSEPYYLQSASGRILCSRRPPVKSACI